MLKSYKQSDNNRHAMLHKFCIVKMAIAMQNLKKMTLLVCSLLRKKNNFLSQTSIVLCSVRKINDEIT